MIDIVDIVDIFQDYAVSRLKNYMYLKEKILTSEPPVSDGSFKRKSGEID